MALFFYVTPMGLVRCHPDGVIEVALRWSCLCRPDLGYRGVAPMELFYVTRWALLRCRSSGAIFVAPFRVVLNGP